MLERETRIVSPTHRRIYQVNMTDPDSVKTAKQLLRIFGWRTYHGQAKADSRGWVIEGTDPTLVPKPATTYT